MSRVTTSDLLETWTRLRAWPFGATVFSMLLGRMVPYTGSIRPRVLELEPGHARVQLRDRRALRNHLESIHAVALMNLAEVTSGLAMLSGLPPTMRGIVTGLSIEYDKKARGTLIASSDVTLPPDLARPTDLRIEAVVRDAANDIVARAVACWRVAPRTEARAS